MKELPSVYSNPIEKEIKNNKDFYYSKDLSDNAVRKPKDITKIADQIFASKDFVYKKNVKIITFDDEKIVTLVGKTNNSLLTLDNQSIPIINIKDIQIIE